MNHKQVEVDFWGDTIEVDEGLAELLKLIWYFDISTENSCQENEPGIAWIEFSSFEDFKTFMDLVVEYAEGEKAWETLYGRIMQYADADTVAWKYNFLPRDHGVREWLEGNEVKRHFYGKNDIDVYASIRFPVTDIPLLVKRLKKCGGSRYMEAS